MTDVFREVDEDLRREQLKQFWLRYGRYLIGLAILIVIGVAVWQFLEASSANQAAESGDRFSAAQALATTDPVAAAAEFEAIAADGTPGYQVLAEMRGAAAMAQAGNIAGAVAAYDLVIADSTADSSIRDVARLRAAMLLVDTVPFAQIRDRLEPLLIDGNAYHGIAAEIAVIAAIRASDLAAADEIALAALADPTTSNEALARLEQLRSFVTGRGDGGPVEILADTPAEPVVEPPADVPAGLEPFLGINLNDFDRPAADPAAPPVDPAAPPAAALGDPAAPPAAEAPAAEPAVPVLLPQLPAAGP